jgi:predicted Zn finger-like uncharacterized protein
MATLVTTCPSCNGPLRIPDELVGQRVRCPSCQTIFHAAAPAAPSASESAPDPERPLWKNLQLELDNGDPIHPEPPSRKPDLIGAVEVGSTAPTEDASPTPQPSLPRARRNPDEDDDDDRPSRRRSDRRGLPRRNSEPHRGALILVLGIISLAALFLNLCYGLGVLVGLPLGITAWVLGSGDLRKINNHEMDEEGLGMTQAGWICGIIGTILQSLVLLTCGGLLTLALTIGARAPAARAPFAPAPIAPPRMAPPPVNKPVQEVN